MLKLSLAQLNPSMFFISINFLNKFLVWFFPHQMVFEWAPYIMLLNYVKNPHFLSRKGPPPLPSAWNRVRELICFLNCIWGLRVFSLNKKVWSNLLPCLQKQRKYQKVVSLKRRRPERQQTNNEGFLKTLRNLDDFKNEEKFKIFLYLVKLPLKFHYFIIREFYNIPIYSHPLTLIFDSFTIIASCKL